MIEGYLVQAFVVPPAGGHPNPDRYKYEDIQHDQTYFYWVGLEAVPDSQKNISNHTSQH